MAEIIQFELNCGKTTCAKEPGVFCQFLLARRFGTEPVCGLFRDSKGDNLRLVDKDGDVVDWLLRCPQCLEHKVIDPKSLVKPRLRIVNRKVVPIK
jgi:hypothetical protein